MHQSFIQAVDAVHEEAQTTRHAAEVCWRRSSSPYIFSNYVRRKLTRRYANISTKLPARRRRRLVRQYVRKGRDYIKL